MRRWAPLVLLFLAVLPLLYAQQSHAGESCSSDSDCTTNSCVNNVCQQSALGGACSTNLDCADPGAICGSDGKCVLSAVSAVFYGSGVAMVSNWVPTASAAVLFSYMLVALAYMIGIGFNYPQVVQWAHAEFWEATLNAAIIGTAFVILMLLTNVAIVLTGSPGHIIAAQTYVNEAGARLLGVFGTALGTNVAYTAASSFWFRFFIPIPIIPWPGLAWLWIRSGLTVAPLGGFQSILQPLSILFYALFTSSLILATQKAFLVFVQNNMLGVFLPAGIIMRSIPLTRKAGGTLIAMALALYFVYPLSLALNKPIFDLYPVWSGQSSAASPSSGTLPLTGKEVTFLVDIFRPQVELLVLVLVLFVLDIILTITAFRNIAMAVGGDPNIFGLGKLGI